jgi:hypothetical protein
MSEEWSEKAIEIALQTWNEQYRKNYNTREEAMRCVLIAAQAQREKEKQS